jgi:hypothetical protein
MRDKGEYNKLDLESQAKTSGNLRKPEFHRRMSLELSPLDMGLYIHVIPSHTESL